MTTEPIHHNVFDGPRDILETHCVDAEDLAVVADGFKRLGQTIKEKFTKEEADKFNASIQRLTEAIQSDEGDS